MAALLPALILINVDSSAAAFYDNALLLKRVEVIDGDTLRIPGTEAYIRLWGIDAPELGQTCLNSDETTSWACGQLAKKVLDEVVIANQDLECQRVDVDRYQRVVARCFIVGTDVDVAGMLVSVGYALDWPQYSNGYYSLVEQEARRRALGVWDGVCTPPWDWRRGAV